MKRGFTILELLVASILLGMLTTIVMMIFSQSSISWRLGTSIVADLDDVRDNIAEIREEADNAFVWDGRVHRVLSPWSADGGLRKRACDADGFEGNGDSRDADRFRAKVLETKSSGLAATGTRKLWTSSQNLLSIGQTTTPSSFDNYTVNVMSGGPRNDIMDWKAIWSYPDDFD